MVSNLINIDSQKAFRFTQNAQQNKPYQFKKTTFPTNKHSPDSHLKTQNQPAKKPNQQTPKSTLKPQKHAENNIF